MAREGCWEALLSVLKLEDLLSPSWRKFETSFERERQSRYKKYITHCRHVHRLIVHFLLRCCGFFPLQCRVDSFHSATQCCPFCFTMLWILSASEPCGFFPLGDSVLCVLFCVVVDSLCSDACECFIACHAHDAVPLVNAAQGSLCLWCARRLLASFLSDVVTC